MKSDEATYVQHGAQRRADRNFSYERRDLERYFGLYRLDRSGIFLKRGSACA